MLLYRIYMGDVYGFASLMRKGQITIPKQIRAYLNIDTGDKLEFIIDRRGRVIISPKTLSVDNIFGLIKCRTHITIEDMNLPLLKDNANK